MKTQLIGFDNGYLKVIKYYGKNEKRRTHLWKCECKCLKTLILETTDIIHARIKSCGCSRKGKNLGNKYKLKHGLTKYKGPYHPLYIIRNAMMTRCYNAKKSDYPYYQGKGIKVYENWKNDVKSFYDWAITNGWKENFTIDRIDSDKDYCPENCRFITREENTKRKNKKGK